MKTTFAIATSVLLSLVVAGCGVEQSSTSMDLDARLARRAELSASGRYLASGAAQLADDPQSAWSDALDLPGSAVINTALIGPAAAAQVRTELGIIRPVRGPSFVLLSTGIAGSTTPEPGTDFDAVGTQGDTVTLRLDLQVPPGANRLSFQYNFLSAESPDFIGTVFNDTFSVQLVDGSGVRPFTVASVNSSEFFPVSNSRAKDSGFNIYAEDPSGVDTEFGTGLPDAGLTDFHSFNADVIGGSSLQLLFTIQDNGDGILDSAVLIDALQFSAIAMVDPNPDLIAAGGALTGNVAALAHDGRPIRGVVADGVTEVVLRVNLPGPGQVEFALPADGTARDGALSTVGGSERQTSVSVRSVAVDGEHVALAVYRAPADFNRGGDDALVERTTQITARYTPDDGQGFESQIDLQIKRPPVVLAHGLWSDVFDWLRLPVIDDPRFAITYASYAYACDQPLKVEAQPGNPALSCPWQTTTSDPGIALCGTERSAVGPAIREALANTRRLGIAVTQADVIAHGAAGIRARQYVTTRDYRNIGNLNAGDINRLITIDTPHLGSRVASAIVAGRQNTSGTSQDNLLCRARLQARAPIEAGDIDALTVASVSLEDAEVPSHAVVGGGGKTIDRRTSIAKLLSKARLYTDIELNQPVRPFRLVGTPSEAFGSLDHDLFSDVISQRGGLPDRAVSPVSMSTSIPDTAHADEYSDNDFFHTLRHPPISDRIVELLNSAVDGPFAAFPSTVRARQQSGFAPEPPRVGRERATAELAATGTLRIVSPAPGSVVVAGDTITVEVAAENGFVPDTVLAVTSGSVSRSDAPPFTMTIRIPRDALGPLRLFALAFDADDNIVISDDVVLLARTDATVESVEILTQDPVLVGRGARRSLAVLGRYSDGVIRDITSGAAGTVYRTSDPEIVAVADDGTLTVVAPGVATVVAQNGTRQDSVTVTVKANAAPLASAGDDASFACVAPGATVPVHFDGSASSDPDGDALSFSWHEGETELASGPTPTVELGAGLHHIDLAVSDGFADVSHDAMQVSILEDTGPPILQMIGENPQTLECRAGFVDPRATAFDACDGDLSSHVTSRSTVDANVPGTYAVDYEVTDRAGLTATARRSVAVVDTTAPGVAIRPMLQLFPPDDRYRLFSLSDCARALDACSGFTNIDRAGEIVAIHSDEPDRGSHPGPFFEHGHDIVILGNSLFKLRDQRDNHGNGRVYEVEFTVHDPRGNVSAVHSCFIGVKLHLHSGPPINDGRVFTVVREP